MAERRLTVLLLDILFSRSLYEKDFKIEMIIVREKTRIVEQNLAENILINEFIIS